MNDFMDSGIYLKISKAISYISENKLAQPSLVDIANVVGVSESNLQRLFSEWVGVSPKKFLMFQTQQYARKCLKESSVLQSALASGLSGSGRLHDLMLTCEGMTPGEYKQQGAGIEIHYGIHDSPFGYCLIARTARGVCKISFFDALNDVGVQLEELSQEWPQAEITELTSRTAPIAEKIFRRKFDQNQSLHILLKGTPFQLKVWQALLSIPESSLCSYQLVANSINLPGSVRAVASAIAKNKLAYLIPCHRVIKNTGEFNQYRWGKSRKAAMIIKEAVLKDCSQ